MAFACAQFQVSERRVCKLLKINRGSYHYETRPDRNGPPREALVSLARQKPRFGYRRLHALLVRRLTRKRLSRVAVGSHLARINQEWALDFDRDP